MSKYALVLGCVGREGRREGVGKVRSVCTFRFRLLSENCLQSED